MSITLQTLPSNDLKRTIWTQDFPYTWQRNYAPLSIYAWVSDSPSCLSLYIKHTRHHLSPFMPLPFYVNLNLGFLSAPGPHPKRKKEANKTSEYAVLVISRWACSGLVSELVSPWGRLQLHSILSEGSGWCHSGSIHILEGPCKNRVAGKRVLKKLFPKRPCRITVLCIICRTCTVWITF